MGTIHEFFNLTAVNTRAATPSPTSTDVITTISSFACSKHPVSEVSKLFIENNIGKEFDLVCDDSENILVGDDIYINGEQHSCLGVSLYEDREDNSDSYLNVRVSL